MKNFVQPGETITVQAPTGGIVSGAAVSIGSLFGVAAFSSPAAAPVEIVTEGVFDLSKTSGDTFNAGDKAYWNDTTKLVTSTATSNLWIGVVTQGANGGAATVRVRLNQHPI